MKIALVIAPYDSGHHKKRLGLGPITLRESARCHLELNGHSVRTEEIFIDTSFPTEVTTSFQVSRKIAEIISEAKSEKEFPVVLTGNCNAAAIGTLSGLNENAGVIWFDCHGDFNTPETTIGGFLDGMAISIVTGQCYTQLAASVKGYKPVPENNIIIVGARDFDPLEKKRLDASGISLISPEMIQRDDKQLAQRFIPMTSVYLHIDLDVLDPSYVKVNGYSTSGGLSPDDLLRAIRVIKEKYHVSAIAFTAYDPSLDAEQKIPGLVNRILSEVLK